MNDLPAPLVAPEVDLRDFGFMPLDVARLRRSRAWLMSRRTPELGFYMLNLWAMSWHEAPAASLEDDDDVLADAAMCDPKRWLKVRADVMRGWVKCSDGRLYHPVVAEKAVDAWSRKCSQRERTEAARQSRLKNRRRATTDDATSSVTEIATEPVTQSVTDNATGNVTTSKGQGQGQGQGRTPVGAQTAPPVGPHPAPDAELYRRGREILGEKAGGIVTKLLRANENSIPRVRAILETASEKSDPAEYIGGVIRARARDPTVEELRLRGEAW